MKARQLFYLIREGFRNTWQNRLMALASVGVLVCCLMLTGFSYLFYVNVEHIFRNAESQNKVAVFMDVGLSDASVARAGDKLAKMSNIDEVEFHSKEDILADFGDALMGETMDSFEGENNPMNDTFMVSMHDLELFDATIKEIQALDGVEEVSYDAGLAKTLSQVRRVVLAIGGGIIGVLLVVSLFIIINTIKLTVHNRRLEIYIMKSVGATDGYVRFPFVVEGVLLGAVAGGIGYGLIMLLYRAVLDNMTFDNPVLRLVSIDTQWFPLLIGFMAGGVLVGVCGSAISISTYLRQEGSERL